MALVLLAIASCTKEDQWVKTPGTPETEQRTKSADNLTAKDHIKIAVLSDIHYMHPSLLQDGAQNYEHFKTHLVYNPNKALLEYSAPIFEQVLRELKEEHPDVLLIAGDMAKDGEKISHEAVVGYLDQLLNAGIKVYVTPGNNDINNAESQAYIGSAPPITVANVDPTEFASMYWTFGYSSEERDPNSLSYLAKPFSELWILSIDAAKYVPRGSRSGRIRPETMQWIEGIMSEANAKGITVLGLMHHDLIEQMADQNLVTPSTVIEDWKIRADALTAMGLKVIFTGHNHATDITSRTTGGKPLYAVQTGSLITPLSSYRIMTLKNKELDIDTRHVTTIGVPLSDNMDFTEYSRLATIPVVDQFFTSAMSNPKSPLYLPENLRATGIILGRNAYIAHMVGDEKLPPEEERTINAFAQSAPKQTENVVWATRTLWTDLNTKDHKWHIKLTNP